MAVYGSRKKKAAALKKKKITYSACVGSTSFPRSSATASSPTNQSNDNRERVNRTFLFTADAFGFASPESPVVSQF